MGIDHNDSAAVQEGGDFKVAYNEKMPEFGSGNGKGGFVPPRAQSDGWLLVAGCWLLRKTRRAGQARGMRRCDSRSLTGDWLKGDTKRGIVAMITGCETEGEELMVLDL
jgi:hypothetical protein